MTSKEVLRQFMAAPPTGPIQDWPQLRESIGNALDELGRLRAEVDRLTIIGHEFDKSQEALLKMAAKYQALRDWQRRALPLIKCWLALSYCGEYFLQGETEMKKVKEGCEELIAESGQTEGES